MDRNVGSTDRIVRIGLGFIALVAAIALLAGAGGVSGTIGTLVAPLLFAFVGSVLLVTGYLQTCPAYQALDIRTLGR